MLVERWLTFSVEDRESALISWRYGVPGSFILLLYCNWCSYRLEMGVSRNLWIVVKDVKPLVVYDVECEMAMDALKGKCASSWVDLGYTNLFLHSWGYICVLLLLWQCSWGFSSVPSGNTRFLTSLIGNREFLSPKCRGIGPYLAASGKSHGFSRVAAGTWGIFSTYGADAHSKLEFVQGSQDTCLGMRDNSGM